ncbi:hypothetical protein GCM10027062_34940 [Nocardioides hungaricus]
MRRRLTVALLAVLVLALLAAAALVAVRWWRDRDRTDLERAARYAPSDAERLSWTDWAAVRDAVGSSGLPDLLDQGYAADLTSTSALVESGPELANLFGFSPATVDWELFSQSRQGAVVILRLPADTDLAAVGDRLERIGYDRPADGATAGAVWAGGADLLAEIGTSLTPELQYVALDADERLVLTSDSRDYLATVADGLDDGADGRLSEGMQDVVAASGDALSAAVYDGPYACSALAMSQADRADESEGDRLVAAAGEVNPMTGFAMAAQPGGGVRVAMAFEGEDQARTNADTRAVLAAGPAPGQGGDFADRFSVESATADGSVVTLGLDPVEGTYVLSDLSTGPVLFATC